MPSSNQPPSESGWGEIRSPSDPSGDAGITRIALPVPNRRITDRRTSRAGQGRRRSDTIDGFETAIHPGTEPTRYIMEKDVEDLTEDERTILLEKLLKAEKDTSAERERLALEREQFSLEKDKSTFAMIKNLMVGFGSVTGLAMTAILGLLVYTTIKHGSFTDAPIVASVMTAVTEVIKLMFAVGKP